MERLFFIYALPLTGCLSLGISHLNFLLLYIYNIKGLVSDFPSNSDIILHCKPQRTPPMLSI